MTYMYAMMEISAAAYEEIREKLLSVGYQQAIDTPRGDRERIDMHGIALVRGPLDESVPLRSDLELLLMIMNDISQYTSFGDRYFESQGLNATEIKRVRELLAPDFLEVWRTTGKLPGTPAAEVPHIHVGNLWHCQACRHPRNDKIHDA